MIKINEDTTLFELMEETLISRYEEMFDDIMDGLDEVYGELNSNSGKWTWANLESMEHFAWLYQAIESFEHVMDIFGMEIPNNDALKTIIVEQVNEIRAKFVSFSDV